MRQRWREKANVCGVGAGGLCVSVVDKDLTAHSLKCYFIFGRFYCVFHLHLEAPTSPPLTFFTLY